MATTAQHWFERYASSHRDPTNKRIHWICVPLIYWSIYALAACVPLPLMTQSADWAHFGLLFLLLAQIYYFVLSPRLGLGLLFIHGGLIALTLALDAVLPVPLWSAALVVFVLAWVGQFIGHRIEGERPAFITDLQFLLIGPAWLLSLIYRRWGLPY